MKRLFRLKKLILMLCFLCSMCGEIQHPGTCTSLGMNAAHADSTSANKGYSLMSTGTNRGQWGIGLNNNFGIIDNNLGGYHTVNVGGSSNVVVSASDAQNIYHKLTGTLTGNIQYVLPDAGGIFIIDNETTGSFTITVDNALGGTGVIVTQGAVNIVYSDATNNKVLSANAVISGIISSANGGTGSAFFGLSGPTVLRTFAFPDANATVLTSNAAVTVPQGGTGVGTLSAHGVVLGAGTSPVVVSSAGTTGQVLTSNGASLDPTFQAAPAAASASTTVQGIVQLTTTSDVNTGTSNTLAVTPAAFKGAIGVSKTFKSAQTSFPSTGEVTVVHGLGGVPYEGFVELVNVTAEGGYIAGDVVWDQAFVIESTSAGTTGRRGFSLSADSTNFYISIGLNGIALPTKDGTNDIAITPAKWKMVVIGRI